MADDAPGPVGEVTRLLLSWRHGDDGALDRLFPLVYEELRGMAHRQLRRGPSGDTLSTTALVHEAYLKLVDRTQLHVNDREHFMALAAKAMRQILVDYARRRGASKRGGAASHQPLEEGLVPVSSRSDELLAIDEALGRLERLDPRLGRLVELRVFGGLSVEESGRVLDVSPRTVKRDWQKARAFLFHELSGNRPS